MAVAVVRDAMIRHMEGMMEGGREREGGERKVKERNRERKKARARA